MKILGLLACFLCFNAISETLLGKVIGVSDGDTLTVLVDQSPFKIRVAGIDAPEKAQAFGQRYKQSLSDCALGKLINVDRMEKAGPIWPNHWQGHL
jgi:endonuclease YncB( thermonuclease family)